jgi:hypothetical protein
MMLVKTTGFGTNWWRRFGSDPLDRLRYTAHAAYFNSTGVQCGNKIRRHWVIAGLIRFNGASNFAARDVGSCIGQTFLCSDLVVAYGGNRVLFKEKASDGTIPDFFLVVVTSDRFGLLDLHSAWKSNEVRPIAVSHLRDQQEALLLMRIGDWIETALGRWYLTPAKQLQVGVALQLSENDGPSIG